jgi:hypothetical protein
MGNSTICLVIPVFNDWPALLRLFAELNTRFARTGVSFDAIIVNDASTVPGTVVLDSPAGGAITTISILDLRANVGHQMAIATGLHYAQENRTFDAVLVMDADGEDTPADALRLVQAWRNAGDNIVVAARGQRSESWAFRIFYRLYRALFRLTTGQSISFGNFTLLPASVLPAVLSRPELFHHLAATLLRTRLPLTTVPTRRGLRYSGQSQMNMPSLVLHALGALSVFSDILFSRMLIAMAAIGGLCGLGAIFVTALRLFTPYAFPNWATTVVSFLTLLTGQMIMIVLFTGFQLLMGRSNALLTSLESARMIKAVRGQDGTCAHAQKSA